MVIVIRQNAEAAVKYPKSGIWVLQNPGNTVVIQIHGANGLKTQIFWGDDQGAYDSTVFVSKFHGFPIILTGPFYTLPAAIYWAKTKPNAADQMIANAQSQTDSYKAQTEHKQVPNTIGQPKVQTACQLKDELLSIGKTKINTFKANSEIVLNKIRNLSTNADNRSKRIAYNKLYDAYKSNASSLDSEWSAYVAFVEFNCELAPDAPIPYQTKKLFHDSIEYLAATAEHIEKMYLR